MTTPPSRATRFLTGLATFLLVVSVGFGLFLLVGLAFGFGASGHEIGVHTPVAVDDLTDLPADAEPLDDVDVLVRVRDASAAEIRWTNARDLAPTALAAAGAWLLRGLLVSVRSGTPFTAANVGRLRALAALILAGVPIATLISSVCASNAADSVGLTSTGLHLDLPSGAIVGGLLALVLAEVFAAGVQLRDDLVGTI